jgi:ERCC4-type nuclease
MADGRLQEQKMRFLETHNDGDTLIYLVEGELQSLVGTSHGVSNAALSAWMLKTSIRDGVCVFRTRDARETVLILCYLQSQVAKGVLFERSATSQSHATALSGAMKRKRSNVDANVLIYMISSIPGTDTRTYTIRVQLHK